MKARHGAWGTGCSGGRARPRPHGLSLAMVLAVGALLSGCASAPPRNSVLGTAPVNAQEGCSAPPPNLRAAYNRTYTVKGQTYTPLRSADGYDEVGMASWYGWESGATTSMGTRFNPRDFSAASRVLPLPTCVQVTNLDNGRSALVLVNDRGPFVSGRILDLSMGAAAALGVTRTGTAQVRVVGLPEGATAPLQLAQASVQAPAVQSPAAGTPSSPNFAPQQFAPSPIATPEPAIVPVPRVTPVAAADPAPITVQTLPPLTSPSAPAAGSVPAAAPGAAQTLPTQAPIPQPALTLPSAAADPLQSVASAAPPAAMASMPLPAQPQNFVQTGAFTAQANAEAERARLQAAGIADVLVVPGFIRGQTFYRVQIGPISGTSPSAVLQRQLQGLGLTAYTVVQQ